ncbi:hypothetical protein GGX14DRAFT_417466, partial [Mycena pura]
MSQPPPSPAREISPEEEALLWETYFNLPSPSKESADPLESAPPEPNATCDSDAFEPLASILEPTLLDELRMLFSLRDPTGTNALSLSTLSPGLVNEILANNPAHWDPVTWALKAYACILSYENRAREGENPTAPDGDGREASPSPPRRSLYTSAVYTNDGATICPSVLDPSIEAPDMTRPVWVSCFRGTPLFPSEPPQAAESELKRKRTPNAHGTKKKPRKTAAPDRPDAPPTSPNQSATSSSSHPSTPSPKEKRERAAMDSRSSPLSPSTRANIPTS